MKDYLKTFSIVTLIISFLELINSQMNIFPNNYLPADDIWQDDISNPGEVNKWVAYAWKVDTAGYRDERLGIYYEPTNVSIL